MANSILDIVEQSLLNIANRYKEFSSNPDVAESDLKGFDEQLNDIMDRYNKLKGLQSTYTAEELTIKLNEFQVLYDDLVLKINNGFFKGADGQSLTFEMLTPEQKESLKGQNGLSAYELASQNGFQGTEAEYLESLKGQDGKDFTFDMFTPEQLQQIANLVSVQTVDLTSILDRLKALEDGTPPISEVTFVDASLSTTDNIEENGTRILTNYLVSLDDIITVEYNVNGNILTHVLKAVSSEGVIYFEEISKDTSSLYDIATGFDFSLSGNLILSTQIYNKSDYSRYAGSYDVNVNISFSNPKAVTLEFLEVTQNSDIFYSWVE